MVNFDEQKYLQLKKDIKRLSSQLKSLPKEKDKFIVAEYNARLKYYSLMLIDKKKDLKDIKKTAPLWIRLRFW